MDAPLSWTDEISFLAEDVRRRRSDEVELGSTWRQGDNETWRLSWLRETGELYLVRNDSLVGAGSLLLVLAVVADERELDLLLDGWREARHAEDGFAWLRQRLTVQQAVSAA